MKKNDKTKKGSIKVQGTSIAIIKRDSQDYISLTDIARHRNTQEPFAIINNWMRGRSTIEFLGLWEKLSNPDFKPLEFERFRAEAGSNYFVLSPQRWIEMNAICGISSPQRGQIRQPRATPWDREPMIVSPDRATQPRPQTRGVAPGYNSTRLWRCETHAFEGAA